VLPRTSLSLVSADQQWSADSRSDAGLEPQTECDTEKETVFVPVPAAGFTRIMMTLAYDGSKFRGMAENPNVVTVVGTLREVLERAVGHPVAIAMAGRTDAGVHAWGQVISFDVDTDLVGSGRAVPSALTRAVNRYCVPSIVARDAQLASPEFDARFSAKTRRYRYTIVNRPIPDPFLAATTWWVPHELDLGALRLGCDALYGLHNFSSFCRRPKPARSVAVEPSLLRRVHDLSWQQLDDGILRFEIGASSFCHQMVRSIVGTLVDMGRGRRKPGEMAGIIRAQDRSLASVLAPPQGLCLWEVGYE